MASGKSVAAKKPIPVQCFLSLNPVIAKSNYFSSSFPENFTMILSIVKMNLRRLVKFLHNRWVVNFQPQPSRYLTIIHRSGGEYFSGVYLLNCEAKQ